MIGRKAPCRSGRIELPPVRNEKLRDHANRLGIVLAHEIHPNTGAICADDFLDLVKACDDDPCLGVFADPSNCWEGEDMETRFSKVANRIYGAHAKNFKVVRGRPLRSASSDWKKRGMHFDRLGTGDLDLHRYTELLMDSGVRDRWNKVHGSTDRTVPLCAEAESAHIALDDAAEDGVRFVNDELCRDIATASFEDGMGA